MKLTNAYCNQQGTSNEPWFVFDGCTNERLYELPHNLSPEQAMSYVHFGRKFENVAYNEGLRKGVEKSEINSKAHYQILNSQIELLKQQNTVLSTKLDQLLTGHVGD